MTGQGFEASLLDAEVLGQVLRGINAADVPSRLLDYELTRLRDVQGLVRAGKRFSRSFAS